MKRISCKDAGEVNSQQSQTIPPSSSHISPECSSYGQWSMAKVQVKHIMHYLGGLLVYLVCHGFVLFVYTCVCVCVYDEWDSFCSFFRETGLCLHLLSHMCMLAKALLRFLSMYVHCAGFGQIVHAKPSECAAMIMVQGQECQQQQRWELVIFKSSAQLPWLLLNVNTTVKHCSEPCIQLHSASSKTNSISFSHKANMPTKSTVKPCWYCGR